MIVFSIPVPASTKNSRILVRGRGRPMSLPSKAARRSVEQIRAAVIRVVEEGLAAGLLEARGPTLFGDDEIAVDVTHNVQDDTVSVKVWSIGPKPKGKTGRKRDLQNLQEGILDTLQGILYSNDSQVSWLQMTRSIGKQARWHPCPHCDDFWCRLHDQHVHDCECLPVDELTFDPYLEPGPIHHAKEEEASSPKEQAEGGEEASEETSHG